MAEVKKLEVWKPHLDGYRNVGDGYENQQLFRTSWAVGSEGKQGYIDPRTSLRSLVATGACVSGKA